LFSKISAVGGYFSRAPSGRQEFDFVFVCPSFHLLQIRLPSFREQAHVLKEFLDSAGGLYTWNFARIVR
jgi:hypothetical protein